MFEEETEQTEVVSYNDGFESVQTEEVQKDVGFGLGGGEEVEYTQQTETVESGGFFGGETVVETETKTVEETW